MSQFDFGTIDPYSDDGVLLADDLNQWRDALYSMQRGSARPAFAQAGQIWVNDGAGAGAWSINVYSGPTKGDLPMFNLDTAAGVASLAAAMKAVTQTSGDSSKAVATTEFVQQAINAAIAIAVAQIFPVGSVLDVPGALSAAPAGWIISGGGTIGNPASNATIRSNDDCRPLYTHLWTGLSQTDAPVTGGRGSSANLDFDSGKPIAGLDFRGLVRATFDAGRGILTSFGRVGQTGGEQAHVLTVAELAQHTHGASDSGHLHRNENDWSFAVRDSGYGPVGAAGGGAWTVGYTNTTNSGYANISIQYAGSSTAHNNVQPTRTVTTLIKL
jgi:microcystin-dependent protein